MTYKREFYISANVHNIKFDVLAKRSEMKREMSVNTIRVTSTSGVSGVTLSKRLNFLFLHQTTFVFISASSETPEILSTKKISPFTV